MVLGAICGEGNGTPLQYSCLENPMDGGAWWAAVYGVAQSRMRLKRLSSSSSSAYLLGHVHLFAIPWTVARQAHLFTGILQARILEWVAISFSNFKI